MKFFFERHILIKKKKSFGKKKCLLQKNVVLKVFVMVKMFFAKNKKNKNVRGKKIGERSLLVKKVNWCDSCFKKKINDIFVTFEQIMQFLCPSRIRILRTIHNQYIL